LIQIQHNHAMSSATNGQRTKRKTQIGFVSSRSGDKSIKVTVAYKTPHPLYQKVVNRQTVLHVHDERNETVVGDKVEVMETRPLSRLKRWRVVSVLQKALLLLFRPRPTNLRTPLLQLRSPNIAFPI
jgi:small subunit ribosomal protein S17